MLLLFGGIRPGRLGAGHGVARPLGMLKLALEKGRQVLGTAVVPILDHDHFGIAVTGPHTGHQPGAFVSFGAADPFQAASGVLMKNRKH